MRVWEGFLLIITISTIVNTIRRKGKVLNTYSKSATAVAASWKRIQQARKESNCNENSGYGGYTMVVVQFHERDSDREIEVFRKEEDVWRRMTTWRAAAAGEWRTKKWEYTMEIVEKGKCFSNREREMFEWMNFLF
jgi:hypothetical protein